MLKDVITSTYMQNRILDEFYRASSAEITIDGIRLYYISIYEKVRYLMNKSDILKEIMSEKERK